MTFNCLVAVALTDLTHMVNSSVDKTAIIFTFQNVGYILGTLCLFQNNFDILINIISIFSWILL